MKILICGDSWTSGYGVDYKDSWPNLIGYGYIDTSEIGASNDLIVTRFLENYNDTYDAVIIGWSGVTRFWDGKARDFSSVDNNVVEYYKDKSLNDILVNWDNQISKILETAKVPVIQYSVFGDIPINKDYFLEKSYLEFLANKSGVFFNYQIPIFEFDWLNENNLKMTESFGEKYFPRKWKRACVERENLRGTGYFLDCGHPTAEGHKLWAEYIKEKLNDIFSK